MTPPDLIWAELAAALTTIAAATAAWILRGAGLAGGRPAAAVLGGVMGGLILSTAVFGRFAPQAHERIFRGGLDERAALQHALREDRAELAAMRGAGLDPDALDAARAQQQRDRTPLAQALADAAAERARAHRLAACLLLAAAAAAAGFASGSATSPAPSPRARQPTRSLPIVTAALLFTAIPTAAVFAILRLFTSLDPSAALAAAAATGAGSMLLAPARWTPRHGRHPAVWTSVAISLTLATAVVLFATSWALLHGRPASILTALAIPLLWGAGALAGSRRTRNPRSRRLAKDAFLLLLAPAAIALPAAHLDLHALATIPNLGGWAMVGVLLLTIIAASDGRWIGAWLGLSLFRTETPLAAAHPNATGVPPLPPPTATDLATETIAAGPLLTQALFTCWLFALGLLNPAAPPGALATAALLLGPVLVEPLVSAYRRAATLLHT